MEGGQTATPVTVGTRSEGGGGGSRSVAVALAPAAIPTHVSCCHSNQVVIEEHGANWDGVELSHM